MLQNSSRLLRLLGMLRNAPTWHGAVLAERLGITERTVRRDVDHLRGLGYRISATPGPDGGYSLEAGTSMPPLLFEEDEALAVSLALRTLAASGVQGIEESALAALVKLEHLMPPRHSRKAKTFFASIQKLAQSGPKVDPTVLATLAGACADHEELQFRYMDVKARASQRTIEPQGLVNAESRWYLVAWDRSREDWRTFRVDRIVPPVSSGARFKPRIGPHKGDLAAYVSRSISTSAYTVRAKVILHAPMQALAQSICPLVGQLAPLDSRRCIVYTGANSVHAIASWLCTLEVEFDIVEPPELLEFLRGMNARVHQALERSGDASQIEISDRKTPA
ncbi:MAG: YafY family protein [Paraburkholderia sp.]|jgi:predicted DNA-binding transcriptional regulator YafY|uniref:helix-turn-helix transcriptional regulator n=1 Tax=Burkholderiaceae TaxID=119060 RepID=UPI0010F8AEDB|nr:YafY family protein [Burkholderia sp. 4M9327F10]